MPLNLDNASYAPWEAYFRTKLANAVYANYLSRRLRNDGILTASVHPGAVTTELFKLPWPILPIFNFFSRPFWKTSWEGAQTTMYTVLAAKLKSGAYYADCKEKAPVPAVFDERVAEELIEASRKAVGFE